ncbi:MAG: ABC transporter permease [Acidimicrobiales bacterium]
MKRLPIRTSLFVAIGAALASMILLIWKYGADTDVTSEKVVVATVVGLTIGALYALSATGLVVVYTTTGTFNFAHGGIGVFSAFVYWEIVENRTGPELPQWLGLLLVVLVVAPALGVAIDLILMRRLRDAPLVVQLMVTVGLMVFLLTLTGQIWQADKIRGVSFFWEGQGFSIGDQKVAWHRFANLVIAAIIAVFLRILLFRTRMGVAMRAVVDNRDLTALNGARPGALSAFAWALGSSLAALAGILVAPEVEFNPTNLNSLMLIVAISAAAFGQIRSLPLTVVGGLLIGLLESYNREWIDLGADFPFAGRAVAPIVLFLVVLALPQARLSVGRVSNNLRPIERTTHVWEGAIGAIVIIFLGWAVARGALHFLVWDPGEWSSVSLNKGISAMVLALIALSLVPLTGWAGQVNFAPLAFAGFGAFLFLRLGLWFGMPDTAGTGNLIWLPVIGLLCAPLGALVALFAARLSGLYLALLSLAFALITSSVLFPHPQVFPRVHTFQTPYLDVGLFRLDFDSRFSFFMLLVTMFALGMFGLIVLRRSRFGRRWVAMQDSQAAAATVGVNVIWTKIVVYATSSAMAGMAGVLWATSKSTVDFRDFDLLNGLTIVLLMAAAGMSFPIAGLFLSFQFVFEGLAERLDQTDNVGFLVWVLKDFLAKFGPGMLAIGMVVNQRGAIFEMGKGFAPLLPWRSDARAELAAEKASKREAEIGGLGLTEPFTSEAVVGLDAVLGIVDDVTPGAGYHHGVARPIEPTHG